MAMPFMSGVHSSWQCPDAETSESYRLGWLNSAVEQGQSWNESQRGFSDWKKSLDIISGDESVRNIQKYRSRIAGHRLKTNIRTSISGLANIRPIWGFHAAKQYAQLATMMNKTTQALYLEGFWDISIKEALAYAAATCTGWIRPVYRRDQGGMGKGDIYLDTYGQPSILPVQLPSNGNFQGAYTVTLMDEIPIFAAHSMFRDYQDRLKPTTSRYWYSAEIRGAAESNAQKRNWNPFKSRKVKDPLNDAFIPIRWTTVQDLSLNETGLTVPMGQIGSSWYYEVPSYGSEISDGSGGTRRADENDSRMYPYRRQIISSENCIMYDGPAFNWHGELDLVPFCIDRWPWEPMGFSMVRDAWENQKAIDEIDRGCMDKVKAQLQPTLGYDINAVTTLEAEEFDPFEPNDRVGYDGSETDMPFKLVMPEEMYRISPEVLSFRQTLVEELDYTLQTKDIVELSKARALGTNMDQMEQLIAADGPIVRDIARSMERSLGQVGRQVGYLILQYLPTGRVMQYVGPEAMVSEVFDYDSSSIVPSHLPNETVHDADQNPIKSQYTPVERARWFARNIRFVLMPHSVHEVTQTVFKLGMMQMKQRGYEISDATVMNAWNVPDVATPDGNTEQERWRSEQEEKVVFQARMAVITSAIATEQGLPDPTAPPQAPPNPIGRPPSGNAPPQLVQKDGGARSTITESK